MGASETQQWNKGPIRGFGPAGADRGFFIRRRRRAVNGDFTKINETQLSEKFGSCQDSVQRDSPIRKQGKGKSDSSDCFEIDAALCCIHNC